MPVAQPVEREVARRHEEERLRREDRATLARPQHTHEGLLHDILGIAQAGEPQAQPREQSRLMGPHFRGEPLHIGGTGRGHAQQRSNAPQI